MAKFTIELTEDQEKLLRAGAGVMRVSFEEILQDCMAAGAEVVCKDIAKAAAIGLRKSLESAPPEIRDALEQMMDDLAPFESDKPTSNLMEIGNVTCGAARVRPDGTIEEVSADELPPEVRAALEAAAKGINDKIDKIRNESNDSMNFPTATTQRS